MYDNLIISEQLRQIVERIEQVLSGVRSETAAALNLKVDKITGKGLSTEDYTTAEKTKLSGVESGAQVNVQSDWNTEDSTSDAYIRNKPSLSGFFDTVDYNSTDKRIYFKQGATLLGSVDTSDFVKDGMVTGAELNTPETGPNAGKACLIITFNSDSEIDPIEIPLELIFNPDNYYTKQDADNKFVEQISGKGLSTNDYTNEEKNKLAGIAPGAQVNVNADWDASSGDAQILNKPHTISGYGITDANISNVELPSERAYKKKITLGESVDVVTDITDLQNAVNNKVSDVIYVNKQFSKTINGQEYPITDIAEIKSDLELTKSDITGLENVQNTADKDKCISDATQAALDGKVDIVPGKQLSANDFSLYYKNKLDEIETKAQVNIIESVSVNNQQITPDNNKNVNITVPDVSKYFDDVVYDSNAKEIIFKQGNSVLERLDATPFIKDGMVNSVDIIDGALVVTFNLDSGKEDISIDLDDIFNPNNYYTITEINNSFVAKDPEKDLSTNDYTNEDKSKLDNIASGAQVNIIETIQKNGADLTVTNKTVNIEIPTNVSEFNNDSGYLTEHQDISHKANTADLATIAISGNYADLINKPGATVGRYQGEYNDYNSIPSNSEDYVIGIPLPDDYLIVTSANDYGSGDYINRWMFRYSGSWDVGGKSGWVPVYALGATTASVEDDTLVL